MTKVDFKSGPAALLAALLCVTALAGCAGNTPKSTAQKYLDTLRLYNYPKCYRMLAHSDQVEKTLEEFLTQVPLAPNVSRAWFKAVLRATKFEVDGTRQEGQKSIVTVKVTAIDLPRWERTIDASVDVGGTPDSTAQASLNQGHFPTITYDDDIALVKQGDEWRLVVDFAQKDRVAKLHKDAISLYHKHEYENAIAALEQAISDLDQSVATGNGGLKFAYQRELDDIKQIEAQSSEFDDYLPNLELSDVDLKMSASRVPAIFGKIKNNGDKAIDEVQMTVTYTRGRGRRKKEVFKEVHTPIATPITFTNFAHPVLPFVPGETRKFGFKLEAPVEIQARANPDLNITAIVFTRSEAPLPAAPQPTPTATPSPAAEGSPAPLAESSPAP